MEPKTHPPRPLSGPLHDLWDRPLREAVSLPAPQLDDGEVERHRMFSLLVLALLARYHNNNKRGRAGDYPWRAAQRGPDGWAGGDYLGHNIACLAVDARGEVIDFDF